MSDNEGEIANEVGEEETIDEVDEFLSKRNAIVKTFIQGIRGLCAEQGRDFRTAINEITIDLPPIAMRTRTYKPNAWNMSLRVAGKEMPAELRKGGIEFQGQLAKYAKEHVYISERRKELDDLVEEEKQALEYKVRIITDPIVKARKKALKALSNSVSTLTP